MELIRISFGRDKYELIDLMIGWLYKNIGPGGYIDDPDNKWFLTVYFGYATFHFRDPNDALIFSLVWEG